MRQHYFMTLQEESEMPTEIEQYYPKAKTQNTHRMDEWSVLGTQMHYVQHPHSGNGGLTLNQCEDKIANQIISKIESPKEMSLQGDSNIVKEVFHDKFEDVVHHLHVDREVYRFKGYFNNLFRC